MYRKRLLNVRSLSVFDSSVDIDIIDSPCVCLGTRITNQMYNGVDPNNSTLLSGYYDDPDSWDVDPACDMSTDRMDLSVSSCVPILSDAPDVVDNS